MDQSSHINEFREKFQASLEDKEVRNAYDERDIYRFNQIDRYALCFLNWRKGNIENALKLIDDTFRWRKERNIPNLTEDDLGNALLEKGIIFLHGRAKDETRIMYFVTRLQTKDMKAETQKLLTFCLERMQQAEPGKHITFLMDVSKSSLSNVDLGGIKFMLDCFTNYFPDMLEKIIILEMPWIMNAIWKVVKNWMTEEQRNRTVFGSFKDLKQYVSPDQITKYMNGTDDWIYSYPPFPDDIVQFSLQYSDTDRSTSEEADSLLEENIEEFKNENSDIEIDPLPSVGEFSTQKSQMEENSDPENEIHEINEEILEDAPLEITPLKTIQQYDLLSTRDRAESEPAFIVHQNTKENRKSHSNSLSVNNMTTSLLVQCDGDSMDSIDLRSTIHTHPEINSLEPRTSSQLNESPQSSNTSNKATSVKPRRDVANSITKPHGEVKLGSLLIMSPSHEVVFDEPSRDQHSGRYHSYVTLRCPESDGPSKSVAFKVKTNFPERYHVKPSTGIVSPGTTTIIRINLSGNNEDPLNRDRFLILYQEIIDIGGSVQEFWNTHLPRESRFEHRLKVRKDSTPTPNHVTKKKEKEVSQQTHTHVDQQNHVGLSLNSDIVKLTQEVKSLKKIVMNTEEDCKHLRLRLRHAIIFQILLLILLFFILYELSILNSLLQLDKLRRLESSIDPSEVYNDVDL